MSFDTESRPQLQAGWRSAGFDQAIDHARRSELAASFLTRVFAWMALGLGVSGVVAWSVMASPALYALTAQLFLPIVVVELVMVLALGAVLHKLSPAVALGGFLAYSGLSGLTLGLVVSLYTASSAAAVFGVTAGTFSAMAAIGAITKKDLSGLGAFLGMGVIAILIASLVNLFLKADALQWAVSVLGALIFTGLTAVDAQRFRKLGYQGFADEKEAGRAAVIGALHLYLDFVNMFLFLLRLFGSRR